MKKKLFLGVALVGLLLCTSACGKKNNNNNNGNNNNPADNPTTTTKIVGPIANTNEGIINPVNIDGLSFSNISLIIENEHSSFTATVTNTNEYAVNVTSFNLVFRDANGNEIITLQSYVGQNLENNQSAIVTGNVEMDLLSATSVEFVKNF